MRFFFIFVLMFIFCHLPKTNKLAFASEMTQKETNLIFRYHIVSEPQSLDPSKLTSTDASYFFNNIMRGLYSYSNERGLLKEGAESCLFVNPLKLVCKLHDTFWSDGTKIESQDYVRSFRRLVSSRTKTPTVELLKRVKNALNIFLGTAPVEKLGVRAEGKNSLVIDFESPDPDFLYKLTASVLVPIRNDTFPPPGDLTGIVFNGPYRVTQWLRGKRLHLESNSFYKRGNPNRPAVEILFIDDEQTAMNLYERNELSFLRRLPTSYIEKYRQHPDVKQLPIARFDYVGFGEDLKNQPDLRAALSYSADFREMQKMLNALGIPGCPGLSEDLVDQPRCVQFDLNKAKLHWEKVPAEIKSKRFKFVFSKLGGDDVKRSMEWLQAQWKKNLNFQTDLEQTEQGVFLNLLRTQPPSIFRKGVGLESPTCLAALETFAVGGAENFLRLNDPQFQKIIKNVSEAIKTDRNGLINKPTLDAKKSCGAGIQLLLDQHWLIPLGRIQFTILAHPRFQGWTLNEMNQLDLSDLHGL